MKKIITLLAAGAIILAPLLSTVPASAATSPSRHVVVLEPCVKAGNITTCWMVMRKHFQFTMGPSEWVARARWSHWNGHSAKGRGTLWQSDVGTHRLGHVRFRLSRPRGHQLIDGHRHPHFTRMHITGHGVKGTYHYWRWEGGQIGEWQATVHQAASHSTVVYGVPTGNVGGSNFHHGRVAPEGKLFWTGDGSAFISHMRWTSWSRYSARGTGKMWVRDSPSFHYKTEHTTLHFHRVRRHNGQRYFTRLHFHLRHKLILLHSATMHFYSIGNPAWFPRHD